MCSLPQRTGGFMLKINDENAQALIGLTLKLESPIAGIPLQRGSLVKVTNVKLEGSVVWVELLMSYIRISSNSTRQIHEFRPETIGRHFSLVGSEGESF